MWFKSTVALPIALVLGNLGYPQTIEDRFAEFEFEKASLSKGFSVLVERVSVTEEVVRIDPGVEREPGSPDYQKELGSMRTFQRIVFAGNKKRMDGVQYSLIGDASLANALREAQLVHENTSWYYEKKRGRPVLGIKQFPVKGGVTEPSQTHWKHPFDITTSEAPVLRTDGPSTVCRQSYNIASETTDGRVKIVAFTREGAVISITFSRDDDWLHEEIDFLAKNMTREEEIARKQLFDLPQEKLKEYFSYGTCRTQWKEIDGKWLPWVTRTSYKSPNSPDREEYEIRFRDWKFKDEFDASLLDEANFTAEKIEASIDFKAIRNLFDRHK
jgi:hypothetical protein